MQRFNSQLQGQCVVLINSQGPAQQQVCHLLTRPPFSQTFIFFESLTRYTLQFTRQRNGNRGSAAQVGIPLDSAMSVFLK